MAFLEGGNEADLNGTTPVTVVAAPGSSTRRLVRSVHFCNVDTVSATIILYKKKGATSRELARQALASGAFWTFDKLTVLDATDELLEAKCLAAITTTNPTADAAYADAT